MQGLKSLRSVLAIPTYCIADALHQASSHGCGDFVTLDTALIKLFRHSDAHELVITRL